MSTDFEKTVLHFIKQQQSFNKRIEEKVDKSQYFLEESIASNAKLLFEEQTKHDSENRDLDNQFTSLESDMREMNLQVGKLQAT